MHVPKDELPWAGASLARVGEAASVPGERVRESRRASSVRLHLHAPCCRVSMDVPTAAPASPARE